MPDSVVESYCSGKLAGKGFSPEFFVSACPFTKICLHKCVLRGEADDLHS